MKFVKDYPLEKYKFTVEGTTVTAESTYCGKPVTAVAKCDPKDEFSLDKGKKLSAARCNLAIAKLRSERAKSRFAECVIALQEITKDLKNTVVYRDESARAVKVAERRLKKVLKELA